MIRPTEEQEFRAEEWPDDDTAREYAALAEMEPLGAASPPEEPWVVEQAAEAIARAADDVGVVADLELRDDWPLRLAEAESTEDRIARRFEGMDVAEIDALAHLRDRAESRELPDDEIARELELPLQ